MADAEAAEAHAVVILVLGVLGDFALIVAVLGEELVQLRQEGGVTDHPRPQALLIQHGQDALPILARETRTAQPRSCPSRCPHLTAAPLPPHPLPS